MKIKKGDNVIVLTGKNRGQQAKVARVLPPRPASASWRSGVGGTLIVEGVNIMKKRQRPRRGGEKGQVVEVAAPIDASNAALFCTRCGRGVRVGVKLVSGKKLRICRRCGQEL